jgi:hypothetical protein
MITKEQLNNINFFSRDDIEYYDGFGFNMMFNIKTHKLYFCCEYMGILDEVGRITKIEDLKETYESIFGSLDDND